MGQGIIFFYLSLIQSVSISPPPFLGGGGGQRISLGNFDFIIQIWGLCIFCIHRICVSLSSHVGAWGM